MTKFELPKPASRWKKLDSQTKHLLEEQALVEKKEFAQEFKHWLLTQDTATQDSREVDNNNNNTPSGRADAAPVPRSEPCLRQPFSCLEEQQPMADNHNASLAILTALHSIQQLIDAELTRIFAAQPAMLSGQGAPSSTSSNSGSRKNGQMWNPAAQQPFQAFDSNNNTPSAFGFFPQQVQQQQQQQQQQQEGGGTNFNEPNQVAAIPNTIQLSEDLMPLDWLDENNNNDDDNEGSSSFPMFPPSLPTNNDCKAFVFRTTHDHNFGINNTMMMRQHQQYQTIMVGNEPFSTMLHQQNEEQDGLNTIPCCFENNAKEQSSSSNLFDSSVDLLSMLESSTCFSSNHYNAMNPSHPNASY